MLPPVLEVCVVWHPGDIRGKAIAEEFVDHFYGTAFTGLIGSAIDVVVRSKGWRTEADAPRPIACAESPLPNEIAQAKFTAIVPLIGIEMAAAVEAEENAWRKYIEEITRIKSANRHQVGVFPYVMDREAIDNTEVGRFLGQYQQIASSGPDEGGETDAMLRCRDLVQGITQMVSPQGQHRLTVFISHTKRSGAGDEVGVEGLIALVSQIIAGTRLQEFFDSHDLQPGEDWDAVLRATAATSALLAIRTDLYPSREWCQREMSISKCHGMPVVIVDALGHSEERGSFLMDHVPRVPVGTRDGGWQKNSIYRALNLLVDECLKRALWAHQQQLAEDRRDLGIDWWAPHAPEPLTFVHWLQSVQEAGFMPEDGSIIRILHPDPPLGPSEIDSLAEILLLLHARSQLDIMTPRLLAARGG